jgi:hypothetical protein
MTDRPTRGGDLPQNALRGVQAANHDPEEERDRGELGLDLRQRYSVESDEAYAEKLRNNWPTDRWLERSRESMANGDFERDTAVQSDPAAVAQRLKTERQARQAK